MNLLDSSGARTLDGHDGALAREELFVFELSHCDASWVFDEAADVEVE